MATRGSITLEDYDHEKSTIHINLADIGLAGATYASETQNLDEVKDAVALVSIGAIRNATIHKEFPESAAVVSDLNAQRERKWLVTYQDNAQFSDSPANLVANMGYLKKFNLEIPAAKVTGLLAAEGDKMILTAGDGLTFKTSLEANIRSPYGGTITVIEVRLVGRNT